MTQETGSTDSESSRKLFDNTGLQEHLHTNTQQLTPSQIWSPLGIGQIRILAVTVQDGDVENLLLSLVFFGTCQED